MGARAIAQIVAAINNARLATMILPSFYFYGSKKATYHIVGLPDFSFHFMYFAAVFYTIINNICHYFWNRFVISWHICFVALCCVSCDDHNQ